jgi:2-oxoglutarate ferredoxin oxidoreductase subunit alpha
VLGYGTAGRVSFSAVRAARAEGIRVGLFRPITLSPLPYARMAELSKTAKAFLVVEMNTGQMLDDVLRAASGRIPVEYYGRLGGVVPFPDEILTEIQRMVHEPLTVDGDPRPAWIKRMKSIINN